MAINDGLTEDTIVAACENHVMSSVGDEVVVLDVDEGVYYGLNEVGADIWTLIQEPHSVGEIVDALLETYAVGRADCMADVVHLLRELAGQGLIEIQ